MSIQPLDVHWPGLSLQPFAVAAALNFEANRIEVAPLKLTTGDSHVEERVMRELELRAFESNVRHGVGAVMCAYNAVNGIYSCENQHLLWQILPAFQPEGLLGHWLDILVTFAALAGVGGIWIAVFLWKLRELPLLPLHDPGLSEPPRHG